MLKAFSATIEINHVVFVFGSIYVIDYVYRFAYIEPVLHPRDEADLMVMDKLFDVLLDLVCQYFIEDFCIDVHQGYWSVVFFSVMPFPGFSIRVILASSDYLGRIPSFSTFWNRISRIGTNSSLNV